MVFDDGLVKEHIRTGGVGNMFSSTPIHESKKPTTAESPLRKKQPKKTFNQYGPGSIAIRSPVKTTGGSIERETAQPSSLPPNQDSVVPNTQIKKKKRRKPRAGVKEAPIVKDEELEFLASKRKREMERQAVGSGAGVSLNNDKKRRRLTDKIDVFPLLNGDCLPQALTTTKTAEWTTKMTSSTGAASVNTDKEKTIIRNEQHLKIAHGIRVQRTQLPIWEHQESLRRCLRERHVLVMLGETGSGKSTQIGQFLLDESWMNRRKIPFVGKKQNVHVGGCVAITQPRRVAAINLAKRVAVELGVRLGDEVGYAVRFQSRTSEKTKIKFLTDGMLLQEMLADPLLTRYSCVVVDEAHERSVMTDLTMGLLRRLVYGDRRGNLKVVVMSATLEVKSMAQFFEETRGEGLSLEGLNCDRCISIEAECGTTSGNNSQETKQVESQEITSNSSTNVDEEIISKKKKRQKKKNKGKFNSQDLIRTPSPVPQPELDTKTQPDIAEKTGSKDSTNAGNAVKDIPYYGTVALFQVPGRQFPVEIYHTEEPVPDYIHAALRSVVQIHYAEQLPGDILVFLTGQEEIDSLQKSIEECAQGMTDEVPKIEVLPLYSALPLAQQAKAFEKVHTRNTRKVILSTNIAETSVTVSGVRYVVDCGKAKLKVFRHKLGMESLLVSPISKSSALQRTGRAGREAPGKCYRLYTESEFNKLKETTTPEIMRTNIANAILNLKARGQDDVVNFDYLSPPKIESLRKALEQLFSLGALDKLGKINPLGLQMAKLPLDPPLARVLIAAADPALDCLAEAVDLISGLSTENLFSVPLTDEAREAMEEARKAFRRNEGDLIMLLEVLRAYDAEKTNRKHWCEKHFVSYRQMQQLRDIRAQLQQYCKVFPSVDQDTWKKCEVSEGTPISPDLAQRVLKAFLRGYFFQTARAAPEGGYVTVLGGHQSVAIHPTSVLFRQSREAVVYYEYVFTTRPFARWCGAVQMDWIADAAPGYLKLGI